MEMITDKVNLETSSVTIQLSRAEFRVYELLKKDLPSREMAEILFLSEKTVKMHLTTIYRKLGIKGKGRRAIVFNEVAVQLKAERQHEKTKRKMKKIVPKGKGYFNV